MENHSRERKWSVKTAAEQIAAIITDISLSFKYKSMEIALSGRGCFGVQLGDHSQMQAG